MLYLGLDIVLWISILVTFVLGLFKLEKLKQSPQYIFVYFAGFALITEAIGLMLRENPNVSEQINYNIFTLGSFLFYAFWFYKILRNKLLVVICSILFLISYTIGLFLDDFFSTLLRTPLITLTVIILVFSLQYFIQLFRSKDMINYNNNPKFWIVTGLLIFYFGFIPLCLMQYQIIKEVTQLYYYFLTLLNIILYGCISKAFLCSQK